MAPARLASLAATLVVVASARVHARVPVDGASGAALAAGRRDVHDDALARDALAAGVIIRERAPKISLVVH